MEQQGKLKRMELQDSSASNFSDHETAIQMNHSGLEESKIRAELENDIERDLEEELKDGICHLAFRLHRLYQHQRDRNARESTRSGNKTRSEIDKKKFSEVNITIKMEGGSKIEINEIKKVAHEKHRPRTSISEAGKHGNVFPSTKKFNWVDTLRSGNGPNSKYHVKGGRNCTRVLKEGKRNLNVGNGKILELGWRS